jgi:aryl-phospho-beta-D-glucosidase BglC (GH1 family)
MKVILSLAGALLAVTIFSGLAYLKMKSGYETALNSAAAHSEAAELRAEFAEYKVAEQSEFIAELTAIGDGISKHGWLSVAGTQLIDEHGESVQLRGMSSHGLTWYPEYVNYGALKFTKEHGANLFRAAMYSDDNSGGYLHSNIEKDFNEAVLYIAIENALAADMYVIADWHLLEDENPLTQTDDAARFFSALSKRYADEPGVIYEICNEPSGDTTWPDIKEYAEEVIPAIRENSPNAVIIVGTPKYSHSVSDAGEDRLDFKNVMYAYHYYTSMDTTFYETLDAAMRAGLPVFVSEWGISESESGELLTENAHLFANYLNSKKISWAAWSLSNKDEPYSVISHETSKLSGWTDDDLTETGKIIFLKIEEALHFYDHSS